MAQCYSVWVGSDCILGPEMQGNGRGWEVPGRTALLCFLHVDLAGLDAGPSALGSQTSGGLKCAASSPSGQQNREALTAFVSQVIKYRNERRGNRSSQASTPGSFLPQGGRRMGGRGPC